MDVNTRGKQSIFGHKVIFTPSIKHCFKRRMSFLSRVATVIDTKGEINRYNLSHNHMKTPTVSSHGYD